MLQTWASCRKATTETGGTGSALAWHKVQSVYCSLLEETLSMCSTKTPPFDVTTGPLPPFLCVLWFSLPLTSAVKTDWDEKTFKSTQINALFHSMQFSSSSAVYGYANELTEVKSLASTPSNKTWRSLLDVRWKGFRNLQVYLPWLSKPSDRGDSWLWFKESCVISGSKGQCPCVFCPWETHWTVKCNVSSVWLVKKDEPCRVTYVTVKELYALHLYCRTLLNCDFSLDQIFPQVTVY